MIFGDGDEDLSYANLDRAFRLVRRGAELIAMHRNGWWFTARGETIDTGAFVAAVEYATGARARVTGKPGPLMYRTAFRGLAAEVAAAGGRRLTRRDVVMVGDDARAGHRRRRGGRACAGSSSCPARTDHRRRGRPVAAPACRRRSRGRWATSSPR